MVSHTIIQNIGFKKWNLGGTLSVKFGIYVHQTIIFRGGGGGGGGILYKRKKIYK